MRELQAEFLTLLPERVEELRSALTLLAIDPAARTTMKRLGHRIAGTAATVYLHDVGRMGRAIEHYVSARVEWTDDDVRPLSDAVALLDEWTVAARTPSARAVDLIGDPRFRALGEPGGER